MPVRSSEQGAAGLQLHAAAEPDILDAVQDLVAELLSRDGAGVALMDRIRFETALVEIVGNVVEHGRAQVAGDTVRMQVMLDRCAQDLVAVVVDDGRPSDVDVASTPMSGPDADSGKGLALARALSTELAYTRAGDANRWTVRCRLAP